MREELVALRLRAAELEAQLLEVGGRPSIEMIRENEARLDGILASVEDIIWSSSMPDRRLIYINPAVEPIYGHPVAAFYANPRLLVEASHPEDRARVEAGLIQLLATGHLEIEHRVLRPDGEVRWLRTRANAFRNADGVIGHFDAIMADITEQRRAEEALRRREQRFRTMVERGWDIVTLMSATGCVEYISGSIHRLLGYTVEQLVDDSFGWLIHPDDLGRTRTLAAELRQNPGSPRTLELRVRHRDGRWIWVETVVVNLLEDPDVRAIVSNTREITARKQSEMALVESERRFRQIAENIQEVFWIMDLRSGRFEYLSPAFKEVWGREPERFYEAPEAWFATMHPDDRGPFTSAMRATMAKGGTESEYRVVRPDGSVRYVRDRGFPVTDETGKLVRMVGIAADITAQKAAERDLAQSRGFLERSEAALQRLNAELEQRVAERTRDLNLANAALSRANGAKDEFLASMSHELRTPLNAVLGLSEALQEEVYGDITEKQRKTIKRIEESGRHLLALINDILDLSKVEAGKVSLDIRRVSLDDVCRASLRLIQEAAHKKRIAVTLQLHDGFGVIHADERRLKQILVNLLSNAVKFTPSGGALGLEVTAEPQERARFTVWDTGIGIAEGDQSRLFQPFVQLDSSLSRHHAGTGLGLALVRRLVDLHGGTVTVESTPGGGSRFIVVLPGHRAMSDHPRESDKAPSSRHVASGGLVMAPRVDGARPTRILLAEDDETNVLMELEFLRSHGYEVIVARNGRDAVTLAREVRPDLILMDIQMPLLDGLGATAQIRADADTAVARVPIVAVTALAMRGDRERCLAAGADEYMPKPISLTALVKMIEQQLARARLPHA